MSVLPTNLSEPPLRRRRRKRQKKAASPIEREISPVQPDLPALSQQDYDQIRELAVQVAAETGQRFVDALPTEVRRKLSPSSLDAWGRELAEQLEPSLSGQLAWALNRAWWEARESGC